MIGKASHSRLARRLSDQGGFSIAEVLVAALILVIGVLGSLQLVDASTRSAFRAEQSQVALGRAQAELEKIRALPYDAVALTSVPAASGDPNKPGSRVSASCASQGVSTFGCFALNRDGTNKAPLVVNGDALEAGGQVAGGMVSPGPEPFQSGDVTGDVHRYVVWLDDTSCGAETCPGTQDLKHVVVVVTFGDVGVVAKRPYREIQSDFVDPEAGSDIEPAPAAGADITAQELWLSDTPCDQSTRQSPVADHPLHNTRGTCADGLQTGASPGAPDLLLFEAPPLDPAFPPASQPLYDLASDIEPLVNPEDDKGIQLREPSTAGCQYNPSGANAHEEVHRWVTEPMAAGFTYILEGTATLDLWTRTLGSGPQSGVICAFLFIREDVGGSAVDTLVGDGANPPNPFFSYSDSAWPSSEWGLASIPMTLMPPAGDTVVRVLPGQQLGVAIGLERDGTAPEDALQFLFEHPDFDSHLEVQTATPIQPSG